MKRINAAAVMVSAGLVTPAAMAQPVCTLPTFTDQQIYEARSFGSTPASRIWCGNGWQFGPRNAGRSRPQPRSSTCTSRTTFDGRPVPAIERAELRGWIRPNSEPEGYDVEGEIHFMFVPDFGWSPTAAGVTPINTPELIAAHLTPLSDGEGSIKVELNHWEVARVCDLGQPPGTRWETVWQNYVRRGRFCDAWTRLRPADWCHPNPMARGRGAEVFGPYDWENPPHTSDTPRTRLGPGDYVRIVGTLWEDDSHGSGACWRQAASRTAQRGWLEVHPVDFIARITPPRNPDGTVRSSSGLTFASVCAGSSLGANTRSVAVEVRPTYARPGPHWRLRYQEVINPEWTNMRSLDATSAQQSGRVVVADDHVTVNVTVHAGALWGGRGMYHAAWRAWWEPGPCASCTADERCVANRCCRPVCAGRCGDDGCGGQCPACASGQRCTNGTCCLPSCDNGCGASPTTCAAGQRCVGGACCTPRCDGRCDGGDDGCGGTCNGVCPGGAVCEQQRCRRCASECAGRGCVVCCYADDQPICAVNRNQCSHIPACRAERRPGRVP